MNILTSASIYITNSLNLNEKSFQLFYLKLINLTTGYIQRNDITNEWLQECFSLLKTTLHGSEFSSNAKSEREFTTPLMKK